MSSSEMLIFSEAARERPDWHWYAIADSAQSRQLPAALLEQGGEVRCLLGANQQTPLAAKAPHLVSLPAPSESSTAWQWIGLQARRGPGVTLIATLAEFDVLFRHLQQWTEVRLPDGDMMFFAFWDPAILGTLVGQDDDATLHVPGPVLGREQRATLFAHIGQWWYWDRRGQRHQVAVACGPEAVALPLQLTQAQMDDLVEASVPDHVLYYLDLNQPMLLADVPQPQRYRFVSSAIREGRSLGLEGMQDLVNYVCAALIYKERLREDESIRRLLESVKEGRMSFAQAVKEMP